MRNKTFEISFPKAVYFGEYWFEDGKLIIDDVHTFDEDEQRVEIDSINDAEIFLRVYMAVEKDKCDEIQMERDELLAERKSRLSDF